MTIVIGAGMACGTGEHYRRVAAPRHRNHSMESALSVHERLVKTLHVWSYVLGLSVMLVTWSLVAWATIGASVAQGPNFNLPNPIPAAQAYNTIDYQRLQR